MQSREGEPFFSCPHILDQLQPFFEEYPDAVFDGELYNHDYKDSFEKIVSLVRKQKPTKNDLRKTEKLVQLHVYDFVLSLDDESSFKRRFVQQFLLSRSPCYLWRNISVPESLVFVETKKCTNQENLDKLYKYFLCHAYEGEIIRSPFAPYQHKRTQDLTKRKPMITKEFKIVAIVEGKGNRAGMAGSIEVDLGNGLTSSAGISGGEKKYANYLNRQDELVGKLATVRFQGWTAKGKLRFPVVRAIRDYE
jgi:ATP-dependent DNA ligase